MSSYDDRTLGDQSRRDSAERQRSRLRALPRLEALETRCLMSGWHPRVEHDAVMPLAVRDRVVATEFRALPALDGPGVRQPVAQQAQNAFRVSSGGDSGPGYGSGSPASDATSLPNIPGLPIGRYVVVRDSSTPHQTFATAQPLPDIPFFGVVGTTASGEPIDLYRLTLTAGAASLDFGLVSNPSAATAPVQLQLFDGSGQVLGEWSVGGQGAASLHAGLGSLPAGATVYFGVTGGNSSGPAGSSPAINYQLWVSLQSPTDRAAAAPGPGPNLSSAAILPLSGSAILPQGGSPPLASASPGGGPSGGDSQAAATAPPNQGSSLRVAVGSPAMRSARPSEGLLADGDPAPAVASDFNAVVNKEWDERSLTGPTSRPADDPDPGPAPRSQRDQEPDALVVIQGPGGFPLLGAVAIGHHRWRSPAGAGDAGDFAIPAGTGGEDRPDAVGLAAQGLLARADNPVAEGDPTAQSPIPGVRPSDGAPTVRKGSWRGFPLSVFSALGVATVFTLNAVLSQPIAGFDYLTARLDAGGGTPSGRRVLRFRRRTAVART
jgi:hypothetical protein